MLGVISHFDKRRAAATTQDDNPQSTPSNDHGSAPASGKAMSLLILDMHRLLHCMEKDTPNLEVTWQALEQRLELLQSLWQQVQQAYLHERQLQGAEAFDRPPQWYRDYEQRIYRATQKARDSIRALQRDEIGDEEDLDTSTLTAFQPRPNLIDQIS